MFAVGGIVRTALIWVPMAAYSETLAEKPGRRHFNGRPYPPVPARNGRQHE